VAHDAAIQALGVQSFGKRGAARKNAPDERATFAIFVRQADGEKQRPIGARIPPGPRPHGIPAETWQIRPPVTIHILPRLIVYAGGERAAPARRTAFCEKSFQIATAAGGYIGEN